jgi:hypothetical protein
VRVKWLGFQGETISGVDVTGTGFLSQVDESLAEVETNRGHSGRPPELPHHTGAHPLLEPTMTGLVGEDSAQANPPQGYR